MLNIGYIFSYYPKLQDSGFFLIADSWEFIAADIKHDKLNNKATAMVELLLLYYDKVLLLQQAAVHK